ncbi:MAG: hypothetical protein R3F17_06925 [Planctomycetota bacterium]
METAARLREMDPVSAELEALHQGASIAWLLDRGRDATLRDQDRLALTYFDKVLEIDPEHDLAKAWETKTRTKLARRLTDEGVDLVGNDEFQEAWRRFNQAVEIYPEYEPAVAAMTSLDRQLAYRQTMASEYYDQGVSALVEKEYSIAANRFGYVRKFRDADDRLNRRSQQVDKARSMEHADNGKKLEEERLFHASRAEYQQALRFDGDNETAREGVRRTALEVEVAGYLARGRGALSRGQFFEARVILEEALTLGTVQTEEVHAVLEEVEQARLQSVYEGALSSEHDWRLEEAIQDYEELLVQAPGFADVQKRLGELKGRVAQVTSLYAEVQNTRDSQERLGLLKRIEVLWPDYRDVPERVADLERRGIRLPDATTGSGTGKVESRTG